MSESTDQADAILNTALSLAENCGWESLRLHDVAQQMDMPLSEIQRHYAQKDDLVEAWFDRADRAMLKASNSVDFMSMDKSRRLYHLIMAWLDELARYKKTSRDMLLYKFEPLHIHLQVLGVLRVSRTVQWFLEASQSQTTHLARITEEIKVTSIYLLTFAYWAMDHSSNQQKTRDFLRRRLTIET
jgi:ubiquinone biosynthesis protein COQ9